jgi:biotin carboxylase
MRTNVFVLGLTDLQRGELETIADTDRYTFHDLVGSSALVEQTAVDFDALLEQARAELRAHQGSVDAVIAHWDFPTSVLAPILAEEHGVPSPSLESVLKTEHKYWSRLEQAASVPEVVPRFCAFDPFDDDALDRIDLDFPFWVKPVKSHSSQLGFKVTGPEDFAWAVQEIRERIHDVGDAFDRVLSRVQLPAELREVSGNACLAEQVISGTQAAPEGAMFRGQFSAHGVFDMFTDPETHAISRLDYPAGSVPERVQERMTDVCERYLRQVGYDNGCFNAEFMWDADRDQLWLIEVNTRISQSHSDLVAKVDGMSNHEVAVDVALGRRPRMPHREGRFAVAAKCNISHSEDAVVTSVPSPADVVRVQERFPETIVKLDVQPGDRLCELPNQDSYQYILGVLYLGGDDRDQLAQHYREAVQMLPFGFAPPEEGSVRRAS